MRRRQVLRSAATCFVCGLAGCTAGYRGDSGVDPGREAALHEPEIPVPREEMLEAAATDAIPAITNPVFDEDWADLSVEVRSRLDPRQVYETEPRLRDDDRVIGVQRGGEARAYPLRVLNWHEVVNDSMAGPLLVTYCPLCRSGVTAVRRVAGEPTRFGVSGLLWRNDLVMYDDATRSLWSQILGKAINGDRAGDALELLPSTLTTWGEWQDINPSTVVLRPPPESDTLAGPSTTRDYRANPYADYQLSDEIGVGEETFDDGRLPPKAEVLGIAHDDVARAYPVEKVRTAGVVNDTVGGLPIAVTAFDGGVAAYVRRVGGSTVPFSALDDAHLRAADTRWRRSTGRAVDGRHDGRTLEPATEFSTVFWFAWLDFYPDSELYG